MIDLEANLKFVISKIEQSRLALDAKHIVRLVVASKYASVEEIERLYHLGQRAFGENKIQDLILKQQALSHLPIEWHFIGSLQKNKINTLINANVKLFHGLDSLELAYELDKRLKVNNKILSALLQVNVSGETTKSGVAYEGTKNLYAEISSECANIKLEGLMSIGTHIADRAIINHDFGLMQQAFKDISSFNPHYLSIGMSDDFDLAIQNGGNMVRVGSTIFRRES